MQAGPLHLSLTDYVAYGFYFLDLVGRYLRLNRHSLNASNQRLWRRGGVNLENTLIDEVVLSLLLADRLEANDAPQVDWASELGHASLSISRWQTESLTTG